MKRRQFMHASLAFCLFSVALLHGQAIAAPRVFPEGQLPNDRRLGPLKDLNGYFPFHVPSTKQQWESRRDELRRRILVACGMWPMPEKTPLNPVIHGLVERDGFTVEKVYFQSVPNHYVTGLLFRPRDRTGKLPAVLCPHGHGGRLQDYGEDNIRTLIVHGAERFEGSGRYPKLARCAQLARMGCVTFIFDMIGYADSLQLPYQLAHRFAKQRPELDTKERWGFYSTQAELRLQSIFGLQTWNSVRALDFLCSLPDVDANRVGVTGGSGGGTQTIMLGAIDPRPVVAFPQGMVSTSMQGGCTCENCSLLRIGTGNVELAALFAPKPQGMTAAEDWTREMMTKGYPELKQLYEMLGAPKDVMCRSMLHFPHNYNYVTRSLMYGWFNKHLNLGLEEPVVEEDFPPLTESERRVWNDDHPRPEVGPDYETDLTRWLDAQSRHQLAKLKPHDGDSFDRFRKVVGGAWQTLIGRTLEQVGPIEREKIAKHDRGDYWEFADVFRVTRHGEELPVVSFYPQSVPWNQEVVIWIDGAGKRGLFDEHGKPISAIRDLLASGTSVMSADLLFQGEFLSRAESSPENRVVDNPRQFAGYTYCYNDTLFAQRVHDILTLISFVRHDEHGTKNLHLVGVNGAAPWIAAARAVAGETIEKTAIDKADFRFVNLKSYRDANFLPGAVKYGDLPALLAVRAPEPLHIGGNSRLPALVSTSYDVAGAADSVVASKVPTENGMRAIAVWLSTK